MNIKIPIFVIVHDRITVLKKSVKSFVEQINTPIEIIFHDVASTYPPCLDYLEEQRKKGHKVYRTEINHHHTINDTVKKYLDEHPECEYYVITDPDIELDNVNGDILEYYLYLMKKHDNKLIVGPMLRIDDIPDHYPKKNIAVHLHKQQFWNNKPDTVEYKDNKYEIQYALIDTTFQLVHRSNNKPINRPGIRCYSPYSARHLDWYIDPKNMEPDQEYYSKNANQIAHWGRNVRSPNYC